MEREKTKPRPGSFFKKPKTIGHPMIPIPDNTKYHFIMSIIINISRY